MFLLPAGLSAAEPLADVDLAFENTAIGRYVSGGDYQAANRLRLDTLTTSRRYEAFSFTFLGDGLIGYDSISGEGNAEFSVYRMYASYEGEKTRILAGRQRIPFGVGRIWNPVDIFNPIDITSIEPDERKGTDSLRMEYSLNDLSVMDGTLSETKAAARVKGFLTYGDAAVILQYDSEENQSILGWELEGDPTSTGVELRSEGGFFYDSDTEETHIQAIVGAEYGFPSSLTLLLEFFHDGQNDENSLGITASYQISMLTFASFIALYNITDQSSFLAPTIQYSVSDEMTLEGGIFLNSGASGTTYGDTPNTLYFRWFAHF